MTCQAKLFFKIFCAYVKKLYSGGSFPLSKINNHIPELHHLCELALYELCTFALAPSTRGPTLIFFWYGMGPLNASYDSFSLMMIHVYLASSLVFILILHRFPTWNITYNQNTLHSWHIYNMKLFLNLTYPKFSFVDYMKLILLGESLKTWINCDNTHTNNQQQQHALHEHPKKAFNCSCWRALWGGILRSESSFHGSQSSCLRFVRSDSTEGT
jgi:hypothetical protein